MSHTHWKKLTNPNYLGSYAFEDGRDLVVTIKSVGNELVTGDNGRKEECTVCHFVENVKPMILNKTNMKTMQKLFGTPYVEEWSGRKMQIYVDPKVKFGREVTGGLRIRNNLPNAQPEQLPKCEECGADIQPIGNLTGVQVAAYTKDKYGKALCSECATKKAQEVTKNADE